MPGPTRFRFLEGNTRVGRYSQGLVARFIATRAYAWVRAIFVRVTINIVEQVHRPCSGLGCQVRFHFVSFSRS